MASLNLIILLSISVTLSTSLNPLKFGNGFTSDITVKNKVFVDYFVALPLELKSKILAYLSPQDLFDFVSNDRIKDYHELAVEAYRESYGDLGVSGVVTPRNKDFEIKTDAIQFRTFKNLIAFLTSPLTRHIKGVKINFSRLKVGEMDQITEYLQNTGVETLKRFEINYIAGPQINLFDEIEMPTVEELSMFGCFFNEDEPDFKKAFPNVRRLASVHSSLAKSTWVNQHFSGLTHLLLHIGNFFTDADVTAILHNNPDLSTLGLFGPQFGIFRTIESTFPNIVNLGIVAFQDFESYPTIHMTHIDRLLLKGVAHNQVPLVFEHLKELHWKCGQHSENALFHFINGHRNQIQILTVEYTIENDDMLSQLHGMGQLQRANLHFGSKTGTNVTATGIFNFIKMNGELNVVELQGVGQGVRMELFNMFNTTGIPFSLQLDDPFDRHEGGAKFVRNHFCEVKMNELDFFTRNYI